MEFYGLNAAGATAAKLAKDIYAGVGDSTRTSKGDYVELGYFASDAAGTPSATAADLFKGNYWIPLTSTTTIGMRTDDYDTSVAYLSPGSGNKGDLGENELGQFFPVTNYTDVSAGNAYRDAVTFPTAAYPGAAGTPPGTGSNSWDDTPGYRRVDTNPYSGATLDQILTKLDGGVSSAGDNFLAIRFYDVDTTGGSQDTIGGQQSDLASNGKQARYNTLASADSTWKWKPRTTGTNEVEMFIHNPYDSSNLVSLEYELPNDTAAYSDVEIGTGGSNTIGGLSDGNTKRTATVAYRDDTALNLANTGDTIVSMLDDATYGTVANITGDATERTLTVMARSTNTTYAYSGDITGKTNIGKIGAGDQAFTGSITTTGALSIEEGTLSLKPNALAHGNIGAATRTQSFEYITDAGSLAIDNDADATHVVELGFAATTAAQTFTGTIALSDTGTNTLKVGGATGVGHQKFSGNISGESSATSALLKKTGGGKLTLSGSGSDFDGGVTITHSGGGTKEGGIVVADHANALGSDFITVEHGKLAVGSGITIANTIVGGSVDTTKKSVIGGGVGTSAGTVNNTAGARLDIGASANDINVVSPGIGLASSMTNGTNDHQVVAGNEDDAGSTAAANSIGILKINKLGLESGGVFDWEVKHFDGTAGTDWDVLQFDTLDFSSGTFDINIYSIDSNGDVGKPTDTGGNTATLWDDGGNSFKFLDGPNHAAVNFTGGGWTSDGSDIDDFFVINADAFSQTNGMWGGDWSVRYDGSGDFFLDYSAAPEPSTYVMVTGLLLLPGFRFMRRFRRRKAKGGD